MLVFVGLVEYGLGRGDPAGRMTNSGIIGDGRRGRIVRHMEMIRRIGVIMREISEIVDVMVFKSI